MIHIGCHLSSSKGYLWMGQDTVRDMTEKGINCVYNSRW